MKRVKYIAHRGNVIRIPEGAIAIVSKEKVSINGRLHHEFKQWWMGKDLPDTILVKGMK